MDKPALLRRLFELGCRYSGQVLSYPKMLGQLQDAGNATTLAHYLDLLAAFGMLAGLSKYAGQTVRRRNSSPKLQGLNKALMAAQSDMSPEEVRVDRDFRGRRVESAAGAYLANAAAAGQREVDFIAKTGRKLTAIEVKSGRASGTLPGIAAFLKAFRPSRTLLVGGDGVPLEDFLMEPVEHWLK